MKCNRIKTYFNGASGDSILLIFVRVVTMTASLLMTRILSDHFSMHDYGTYSQVMLLINTVMNLTSFGLLDGINFFFCREQNEERRNAYISTIFAIHYIMGFAASLIMLLCTVPISAYFQNEDLKPLIVFCAFSPIVRNSIAMLQVMFVTIGKAKLIAFRNLIVSALKLVTILLACFVVDNIIFILCVQLATDIAQTAYFFFVLGKNKCRPSIHQFSRELIPQILTYCIPMAMFTMVKALNRDCDKFVVSFFTDTETLALYANASKQLPFDIIMSSFCTVLQPYITRYIAEKNYKASVGLYRAFLEISLLSTGILALSATAVAPELIQFLYTDKYLPGLDVFRIYILIDILNIMCITLVLSASGWTKTILYISLGAFTLNIGLNILLFKFFGILGPALGTLVVTLLQGFLILFYSSKAMHTSLWEMLPIKTILLFTVETAVLLPILSLLRRNLADTELPYFLRMIIVGCCFAIPMIMFNFRRMKKDIICINQCVMD